jgi:hypothetical protein
VVVFLVTGVPLAWLEEEELELDLVVVVAIVTGGWRLRTVLSS